MTNIGIDPGLGGAVAVVDKLRLPGDDRDPNGSQIEIHDTPIFDSPDGRREPDPHGMASLLRDIWRRYPQARAILEWVQAFPKNGSIGNFKMGQGFGLWQMALAALGMPHELVRPQRWKKYVLAGAPKTPQGEAAVAVRLYPVAAGLVRGPKGGLREGRVDALLLAHYGTLERNLT